MWLTDRTGNVAGRDAELVHRAVGGRLNDVARELEQVAEAWDRRLAHIKRLAEAP